MNGEHLFLSVLYNTITTTYYKKRKAYPKNTLKNLKDDHRQEREERVPYGAVNS